MHTNTGPLLEPKSLGIKLDLGCGNHPRPGFEGVDMFAEQAKWHQNLFEFPWPWGDGQCAELYCSHFIEHIPMLYVDDKNNTSHMPSEKSVDLMVRFFDECWRVLAPGGRMTIVWPNVRSDRAFQDPTHRRFIPPMMVAYLNQTWRTLNGLTHYLGTCNFTDGNNSIPQVTPIGINPEFEFFAPEASQRRIAESWNVVNDWQAILIKDVGSSTNL